MVVQQEVGGFDIAVEDALAVGVLHASATWLPMRATLAVELAIGFADAENSDEPGRIAGEEESAGGPLVEVVGTGSASSKGSVTDPSTGGGPSAAKRPAISDRATSAAVRLAIRLAASADSEAGLASGFSAEPP